MTTTIGSLDLTSQSALYDETQYFWFESSSSSAWGAGAHVTLYPESEFTNSSSTNYLKGQNILMNTDGLSIRNGVLPMMTLDNDSLDFNVIDLTNGTYKTAATFSATGAQIGQSDGAHSVIDANGQRFYGGSDGTIQLANIGYGVGQGISSISNAPYYTFGRRLYTTSVYDSTITYEIGDLCLYNDGDKEYLYVCITDITTPEEWNGEHWQYYIGNGSVAEGGSPTINVGNIASGANSHAEGRETKAIGYLSHTEGRGTKAIGQSSHAEGYVTTASGSVAHAEGWGTMASGGYSHSEGLQTKALGDCSHAGGRGTIAVNNQMVIGDYNISDSNSEYAFIVGNGNSNNTRSNAFMVDKTGDIYPQATKMTDFITEQGSVAGNHGTWYYRKWKNGMVEAWYNMDTAVSVAITTSAANTYRGSRTITIPSGIFTSTPIFGNVNTTQAGTTIHGNIRFVSNTQAEALFTRDASGTVNVTASIYLMGYETT